MAARRRGPRAAGRVGGHENRQRKQDLRRLLGQLAVTLPADPTSLRSVLLMHFGRAAHRAAGQGTR